ncbi:MAG: 16S rRNA (uracil(1498)-N(3))-methyltransferase [Bacillota bacterium]|nr:16S rRNA (uracil(1498)-N(3))-methyltransferase [Bacillota bacterium]
MPRFFVNPGNIYTDKIIITGEDFNHIKNVLRLRKGEELVICDGAGKDFRTRLEYFDANSVVLCPIESWKTQTEPPVGITLFQGLPKSDKMDFIIQKSVELGVNRVVPVITERTVVKLGNKPDIDKKVSRWQKISLEAAKQCNRGIIPHIDEPVIFKEALLKAQENDLNIIPFEKENITPLRKSLIPDCRKISFFIGPEGGFSDKEIEDAVNKNVIPVTLGPRILRTETAGIVVLSILMYELGDLG